MIPIVDLFAGPGGLGEGFSSAKDSSGNPVFQIIMSVEKDSEAYKTLRLRSYLRKILHDDGKVPQAYETYMRRHTVENFEKLIEISPSAWMEANREAVHAELVEGDDSLVEEAGKRLKAHGVIDADPWVLIGGPPCQAYSLVGRSRRAKEHDKLEADVKQTLYKCYLAFINELKPTVFVMENVKGLLSARHKGAGVFDRILSDMEEAGYEIHSLVHPDPQGPRDYVVQAEDFGIPQARHRVILLGIRSDAQNKTTGILQESEQASVRDALAGIPSIRSGFSMRNKDWKEMNWSSYVNDAATKLEKSPEGKKLREVLEEVKSCHSARKMSKDVIDGDCGRYGAWYRGRLGSYRALANHEARTHMASDLDRYLFCSSFAEVNGFAAQLYDFPNYLIPKHSNAQGAKRGEEVDFSDRFRVQLYDRPSTTITSHISKDGHYYIHPDPRQCRSLTVREAARLQTFPDDYLFEGNRTAQYTQVGNAVPPMLAQQIAAVVADYLGIEAKPFVGSVSKPETSVLAAHEGDRDSQRS